MSGDRQIGFDFADLGRAADERAARGEIARTVAVQLAAVPAELVGVGPVRWEHVQRWLYFLALTGSGDEASCLAGLTGPQSKRARSIAHRLGLTASSPRFDRSGRRLSDVYVPELPTIAELADRARSAAAHVRRTSRAPPAHLESTSGARPAHPVKRVAESARAGDDLNDLNESFIEISDQIAEKVRRMVEADWWEVRRDVAAVVGRWNVADPRTVRAVIVGRIVFGWLGQLDRFGEIAKVATGKHAPWKYAHMAWRNEAEKCGVPYHDVARAIGPLIPEWMLMRREEIADGRPAEATVAGAGDRARLPRQP